MMNKEELYKLALSNVPRYSLLNEILAIRDNRFPDEENDYTIKVYGSISLDVLNRYVRFINELVEYENIDTINNLKDLQQRINDAIEYIEKEGEHTDCSGEPIYYLDEEQEEELLEILGGKE